MGKYHSESEISGHNTKSLIKLKMVYKALLESGVDDWIEVEHVLGIIESELKEREITSADNESGTASMDFLEVWD